MLKWSLLVLVHAWTVSCVTLSSQLAPVSCTNSLATRCLSMPGDFASYDVWDDADAVSQGGPSSWEIVSSVDGNTFTEDSQASSGLTFSDVSNCAVDEKSKGTYLFHKASRTFTDDNQVRVSVNIAFQAGGAALPGHQRHDAGIVLGANSDNSLSYTFIVAYDPVNCGLLVRKTSNVFVNVIDSESASVPLDGPVRLHVTLTRNPASVAVAITSIDNAVTHYSSVVDDQSVTNWEGHGAGLYASTYGGVVTFSHWQYESDNSVPVAPAPQQTTSPAPQPAPNSSPQPSETPNMSPQPNDTPNISPQPNETPNISPQPNDTPNMSPQPNSVPNAASLNTVCADARPCQEFMLCIPVDAAGFKCVERTTQSRPSQDSPSPGNGEKDNTNSEETEEEDATDWGLIAGIIIASVCCCCLIVALVIFLIVPTSCRSSSNKSNRQDDDVDLDDDDINSWGLSIRSKH